jgi:hypothetical protein
MEGREGEKAGERECMNTYVNIDMCVYRCV